MHKWDNIIFRKLMQYVRAVILISLNKTLILTFKKVLSKLDDLAKFLIFEKTQ